MKKTKTFARNSDQNYNDYYKTKTGSEILKTLKQSHKENNEFNEVSQFKSYSDFFKLSNSYYKYLNIDECEQKATKNIDESNISCVDKDRDEFICEKNKNILYPYGSYNEQSKCDFFFPYKIDISKWCSDKINCPPCLAGTYPICPPHPCPPKPHPCPCPSPPQIIPLPYPIPFPIPNPNPIQNNNTINNNCIPQNHCKESQNCDNHCDNHCDKCITPLCRRGLCDTCNKKKQDARCPCKSNHNDIPNTKPSKKTLKTGTPFR